MIVVLIAKSATTRRVLHYERVTTDFTKVQSFAFGY